MKLSARCLRLSNGYLSCDWGSLWAGDHARGERWGWRSWAIMRETGENSAWRRSRQNGGAAIRRSDVGGVKW